MSHRTYSPLALLAALLLFAPAARGETVVVNVFNYDYSVNIPGQPIVDPVIHIGDTIQWRMWATSSIYHTSTSCDHMSEYWLSPRLFNAGQTFDHTFTHEGVFGYYCEPHGFDMGNGLGGGMSGTITVIAPAPAGVALMVGLLPLATRRRR